MFIHILFAVFLLHEFPLPRLLLSKSFQNLDFHVYVLPAWKFADAVAIEIIKISPRLYLGLPFGDTG